MFSRTDRTTIRSRISPGRGSARFQRCRAELRPAQHQFVGRGYHDLPQGRHDPTGRCRRSGSERFPLTGAGANWPAHDVGFIFNANEWLHGTSSWFRSGRQVTFRAGLRWPANSAGVKPPNRCSNSFLVNVSKAPKNLRSGYVGNAAKARAQGRAALGRYPLIGDRLGQCLVSDGFETRIGRADKAKPVQTKKFAIHTLSQTATFSAL